MIHPGVYFKYQVLSIRVSGVAWVALVLLLGLSVQAQVTKFGTEFNISGVIPGDQVASDIVLGSSSGLLVWQDNATDGDGWGISAVRLDGLGRSQFGAFRVNHEGAGDQENPAVAQGPDGRFYIVYQSGSVGNQNILLRILNPEGGFDGGEILVNSHTQGQQEKPAIAVLNNGNLVVVWSSLEQDGHLSGVYGQMLTPEGLKVDEEFRLNTMTPNNQRDVDVASLANGGFVVVWISEISRSLINANDPDNEIFDATVGAARFDIVPMAKVFDANGISSMPAEVMLTPRGHYAHPTVVGNNAGGFTTAFSYNTTLSKSSGWDVQVAGYNSSGVRTSSIVNLNTYTFGDQLAPRLASANGSIIAVWQSLGEDGSHMGVLGRGITADGTAVGEPFIVNTTRQGNQIFPSVTLAEDGKGLVVWSSYAVEAQGLELFAQSVLANVELLIAPNPPMVASRSSHQIALSWSNLEGVDVQSFALYVDGAEEPMILQENQYVHTPLLPGSQHTYALAYQTSKGNISPKSSITSTKTWGSDTNFDGLPDDWQRMYWPAPMKIPGPLEDSDGDGATNRDEFLAGTDPTDPSSVLKTSLIASVHGWRLNWNTTPGNLYQVQLTEDLVSWMDIGAARLAAGTEDSILLSVDNLTGYFRVILIR